MNDKDCLVCRGKGEIQVTQRPAGRFAPLAPPKFVKCEACGGTGQRKPRAYTMLRDGTKDRARALVEPGGAVREVFDRLGIPLLLIKDSFDEPPPDEGYEDTQCLSYGMCGEIRHNGDVQLCSESYGDPEYTIGNIFEADLTDILRSGRRRDVLTKMNERHCYQTKCPHNSRGHHHNRVFHRIEKLKREDRLSDVEAWISDMRACTLPLGHSFFL
jgi:hypothetical protein